MSSLTRTNIDSVNSYIFSLSLQHSSRLQYIQWDVSRPNCRDAPMGALSHRNPRVIPAALSGTIYVGARGNNPLARVTLHHALRACVGVPKILCPYTTKPNLDHDKSLSRQDRRSSRLPRTAAFGVNSFALCARPTRLNPESKLIAAYRNV